MKFIGILVALALYVSTSAQTVQQQKAAYRAIKAFSAEKYPEAKTKMIIDEPGIYRLRFKMESHRYNAIFNVKGEWVKTEEKIKLSEIPAVVKQILDTTKYKSSKTYLVSKIALAQRTGTLYSVEVRYDIGYDEDYMMVMELHKLYFTDSGAIVKDELEPDDSLPYLPWDSYLF